MKKILTLSVAVGAAFFLSACSPDTSWSDSDSSDYSSDDYSSSSSYSGSCFDAGGGICGYYSNMNESEYDKVRSPCSEWYDSQNVCDGDTRTRYTAPGDKTYTQICYMDTTDSDSHMDVYNYGLTYEEAQWSEEQCYSYGGDSSINSFENN